jgi:hypothetical protein
MGVDGGGGGRGRSMENNIDIMVVCYCCFSSFLRFPTSLKVRDFFPLLPLCPEASFLVLYELYGDDPGRA